MGKKKTIGGEASQKIIFRKRIKRKLVGRNEIFSICRVLEL